MTDDEVKDQIDSALGGYSEEELKKLAQEIVEGKVFTDRDIRPEHGLDILMVFLPVALMPNFQVWAADVGLLYEYWSEALPRSCNGCPMFMSVRKVRKQQMPALEHYVRHYWELKKKMEAEFNAAPIPEFIPPTPGS